jgi:hypothetical protein
MKTVYRFLFLEYYEKELESMDLLSHRNSGIVVETYRAVY